MAANDRNEDRLGQWLDSALKQYGNVEPRAGLELRVMANLEARSGFVTRPRWAFAMASVAVVCATLFAVWHIETSPPTGTKPARVLLPNTEGSATKQSTGLPHGRKNHAIAAVQVHTRRPHNPVTARAQKFPSPLPLTHRELALAAYAKSFPKEAERIAQEQETFEQEVEQAQLELQNYTPRQNQER